MPSDEHRKLLQNSIDQLVQWTGRSLNVGKNNPESKYFMDGQKIPGNFC